MLPFSLPRIALAALLLACGLQGVARAEGGKHVDSSLITLEPYRERYQEGEKAELVATVLEGSRWGFCAVTLPGGQVVYVRNARQEGASVHLEIPLESGAGRYQIELVVTGDYGNQVAANVDVYVGEEYERPAAPSDDFDQTTSDTELARRLYEQLIQFRQENGCTSLPWDPTLARIADEHAEACAEAGRLAHVLPEAGGSVADRARAAYGWDVRYGLPGFPARRREGGPVLIGDNLAVCANPELAIFLLAESPGHRAALVNPHVDAVGIGAKRKVTRRGDEVLQGIYFCMVFAQVNDLDVLAQMQSERRLETARGQPGGSQLALARSMEKKGKLAKALIAYRRFLDENPDSEVSADVRAHLEELELGAGEEIAAAAKRQLRRRHDGMLQVARNFLTNDLPGKAAARIELLLAEHPEEEIARAAQELMEEITRKLESPPR
jgi:uncharacterized protein YkwD